jgi:hypothetical protein
MTKQLYEEALADVKKIKEIAEDNAKKALIEAVAPRIKDLIEAELLREVEEGDTEESVGDAEGKDEKLLFGYDPTESLDAGSEIQSVYDQQPSDMEPCVQPTGDNEFVVSMESKKLLKPLVDKIKESAISRISLNVSAIETKLGELLEASKSLRQTPSYNKIVSEMVSEVENLYQTLQETVVDEDSKGLYENKLEKLYKDLNQLTEQNMKNRLTETGLTFKLDLGDDLPEEAVDAITDALAKADLEIVPDEGEESAEGDEGEGDLDLDAEEGEEEAPAGEEEDEGDDEEGEEEVEEMSMPSVPGVKESLRLSDDVIVEIDEKMLKREISRMKMLREAADDVQSWGHGAGEVSDDFSEEEMDALEVDLTTEGEDMGEGDDMSESDYAGDMEEADHAGDMEEADDVAEYGGNHGRDLDQSNGQARQPVKETLEAKLVAEAKKKKAAKDKAMKAKKLKEKAAKDEKAAKSVKEKAEAKKKKDKMHEAYNHFASQYNESVRRIAKLQTMLAETNKRSGESLNGNQKREAGDSDNLRKKLAETNLFNMKLLYTNKLLQNESLTKRQKADVIERLDEAKTEREVKLVYESLVKTLAGSSRASLSEGSKNRVVGSSSAPTRAASTVLNEGFEADRWAKLAGLK